VGVSEAASGAECRAKAESRSRRRRPGLRRRGPGGPQAVSDGLAEQQPWSCESLQLLPFWTSSLITPERSLPHSRT
jgi:hypothetical protein